MNYFYLKIKSPLGDLHAVSKNGLLHHLFFDRSWKIHQQKYFQEEMFSKNNTCKTLTSTKNQLKEYFLGKRQHFTIPLKLNGTDFQKKAWNALLKIHYGKTTSYKIQAIKIKHPNAYRAVGTANGANPICIIVPCHRVLTHTGAIGGYAGGMDSKIFLLELEKKWESLL